jgi:hypothetical protein
VFRYLYMYMIKIVLLVFLEKKLYIILSKKMIEIVIKYNNILHKLTQKNKINYV